LKIITVISKELKTAVKKFKKIIAENMVL